MCQEELERTLEQAAPGRGDNMLAELKIRGRAQVVERYGIRFWSAAVDPRRQRRQKQRNKKTDQT